ncbi:MAG: SDR family oxidoreductase [Desulfobacteraceae bacterium]|nr:MAG: SDR family oxidoreductase [Desulfobacteraceae bacterium]
MDLELKGKTALITGAGQGVGREIARVLAAEGVKVAVNDLFQEKAEAVAAEIQKAGGEAMGVQADVGNLEQVRAMADRIVARFGTINILVNNAGVPVEIRSGATPRTVFAGSEPSFWQKQVNLNFYGCLNCTDAVIKPMIESNDGKIISIISEAGRTGEAYMAVYSGAKAGVLGFSKALAKEVGRYCINVNCIAIGATAHEGTSGRLNLKSTPENDPALEKMLKVYPIGRGLGRLGRAYDPAYAVAFLASPRAAYITGQVLSVSGGFSMC